MTNANFVSHLREGSTIHSMYTSLKDGKLQKFSTFRSKYRKAGVKRPKGMLFRLCRLLRRYTDMQINFSGRRDYVQMVKRDKAEAARITADKSHQLVKAVVTKSKPVVKAKSKPVTKKKVVSHTTKKEKKPSTKKAVAAGHVDDDDVLEA